MIFPIKNKNIPAKLFILEGLSALVQYYSHHLFGFMAVKISQCFMPKTDLIIQILNVYLIMAITVFAKPIGAIILGKIGDKHGRITSTNIGLICISISSFIIAILPCYTNIGLISTIILLMARMLICASAVPSTDGIKIYVYENLLLKNKCFGQGILIAFIIGGSFVASTATFLFTLNIFPEYSWRFAFLFGGILDIVLLFLRKKKYKTSASVFKTGKEISMFQLIKENLRLFILSILLHGIVSGAYQFSAIFLSNYTAGILHLISPSIMYFYTSAGIMLYIIFSIISGIVSDIISRRIVVNAAIIIVMIIILFAWILSCGRVSSVLYILNSIALPFITIPTYMLLQQAIPSEIKHRLYSLSHALGSSIISAPTSFLATLIYYKSQISWFPMVYLTLMMVIAGITINLKEFRK